MGVVALLIVFLAVVGFVGWPLLNPSEYNVDEDEMRARYDKLLEEKERLLTEIKDFELAHETGKLTTQDYSQMSSAAKRVVAKVFQEIDEIEPLLGQPHAQQKPPKKKRSVASPNVSQARTCPSCSTKYDQADAFCRSCGASLQT